jgi:hypothetical protein
MNPDFSIHYRRLIARQRRGQSGSVSCAKIMVSKKLMGAKPACGTVARFRAPGRAVL